MLRIKFGLEESLVLRNLLSLPSAKILHFTLKTALNNYLSHTSSPATSTTQKFP